MVGAFALPNYAIILSEMSNLWEFYNVDISTNNNNSLTYNSCFFYAIYFSYDSFLLIIYSFIEKKIVMGLVSVLFSLIQFIFVQLGKINP